MMVKMVVRPIAKLSEEFDGVARERCVQTSSPEKMALSRTNYFALKKSRRVEG